MSATHSLDGALDRGIRVHARPYTLTGQPSSRRAPWEQLMVAAPWLYRLVSRSTLRLLPVDSPLRRSLLGASFRSGFAAFNRRDFELMLVRYKPGCEFVTSLGLRTLGASDSIRSHDGLQDFVEATAQAWQGWELVPRGFIDLGDQVLWLANQRARGGSSQIPIEDQYAQLQDLAHGLISRQQAFNDWDAALQAAGLHRDRVIGLDALGGPSRLARPGSNR
jgi:hypothetical protein